MGTSIPWSMLTGERTRWDKLRIFGADAYLHRPNNSMAKIPGIVRGQKLIFVGFSNGMNGFRLFDPEARRYYTHSDEVFYESFKHRIDALRHHDKRRALLKKGLDQPIVLNDFEDENADGVRNLFLNPDATRPASSPLIIGRQPNAAPPLLPCSHPITAEPLGQQPIAAPPIGQQPNAAPTLSPCSHPITAEPLGQQPIAAPPIGQQPNAAPPLSSCSHPITAEPPVTTSISSTPAPRDARLAQDALRSAAHLRPVRLLPVGTPIKATVEDMRFLRHIQDLDAPIFYVLNPKASDKIKFIQLRQKLMT